MIRRTGFVAAAVSVVPLAAACGRDDADTTAPPSPPTTEAPTPPLADTAAPAPPAEEPVELTQAGGRLAEAWRIWRTPTSAWRRARPPS